MPRIPLRRLIPLAAALCAGSLAGLGSFTFVYGEGAAYLRDDPSACANCHVMQDHFDTWVKSSHRDVATCNDCHLPHDAIGAWVTKADNGFFHSLAFSTGDFAEPIRIKDRNARVTQGTCLSCHAELVHPLVADDDTAPTCVRCHADVGHAGRR